MLFIGLGRGVRRMIVTKRPQRRYFPDRAGKEVKRFNYQEACYAEWLVSVGRGPVEPAWVQRLRRVFG